ncbi:MAG: helix-turn-helix transcriptional regulator [Acidobacteriota bacterium]|nr:helix-turn-helix transcriptional regulator [Acidobacteriota bacterium]
MARRRKQAQTPKRLLSRIVGMRIREIRVRKGLSQTELEKISGLPRSHISRVEGAVRTPTIETLERLAKGLGVPLYVFFYPGKISALLPEDSSSFFGEIRNILPELSERDCDALLAMARKLAARQGRLRL